MVSKERANRTAAVALIVCVFAVDPGGLSASGPARYAAFAVVLGVGAFTVAADQDHLERRRIRPFLWGWAVLLFVIACSVLAGDDRWHGIFGSSERNLGLLTWVGFAIAFFLGAVLPSDSHVVLSRAATVVVAGMSGLALLERLGLDPTGTAWTGSRVGAPFAQSTYLAVALAVLGPLVAGSALDRRSGRTYRRLAGIVTASGLITMLATQSRGPVLGLALALVMVCVVRGKPRVGAIVGVSATAAVVALSLHRGWGSFDGRLDEWRIGMRGIRSRPLLGFGPEGYRDHFPQLVDANYVRANGAQVITDRAHNGLIDVALSSGVIAALALAALWLLIASAAMVRARETDVPMTVVGLAVAVLAGFSQQLLLFPLAEIDPILWMFAGVLVGHTAVNEQRLRRRSLAWTVAALGSVAMLSSFWWNATSAVGEHRIAQATSFRQERAETVADGALALRPQAVRLAYAVALVHSNGPTLRDLDEAITILEGALALHPGEPALRTEYVFRLVERARRSGLANDVDRAVAAAANAVENAPNSPGLLGAYAEALQLDGRLGQAREQVGRAIDLDPDDTELQLLAKSIEKS